MAKSHPLIGIPAFKSTGGGAASTTLYALNPLYSDGVLAGAGAPIQIPQGLDQGALRAVFDRLDGLLLAGGGDVDPTFYQASASERVYGVDRERDQLEMTLVRWAVEENKPLLAICRGIQVMNVALGGSLFQDVLEEMPGAIRHAFFEKLGFARDYRAHEVRLTPGSDLARLLGSNQFGVNSLHHQGIKELAPTLTAVGRAPDDLVEAVQVEGHAFAIGVQWHPEALAPADPMMLELFRGLVEAAQNGRNQSL